LSTIVLMTILAHRSAIVLEVMKRLIAGILALCAPAAASADDWTTSIHPDGWSVDHPSGMILGAADFQGERMIALLPPNEDGTTINLIYHVDADTQNADDTSGSADGDSPRANNDLTEIFERIYDGENGDKIAYAFRLSDGIVLAALASYAPDDVEAGLVVVRRVAAYITPPTIARPN
jgi:hypothetical protein